MKFGLRARGTRKIGLRSGRNRGIRGSDRASGRGGSGSSGRQLRAAGQPLVRTALHRLQDLDHRDGPALDVLPGDTAEQVAELVALQCFGNRDEVGSEVAVNGLLHRAAAHDRLAGETLDQDQPPGVEVGAQRRRVAEQLLGSRVDGRAEILAPHGQQLVGRPGGVFGNRPEAEVEHQRVAAGPARIDHDVGGLQVAVDDLQGVRGGDGVDHLGHEVNRFRGLERAFRREHVAQVPAGNVGEDRANPVFGRSAEVEDRHDVRVVQLAAETHLAPEALDLQIGVGRALAAIDPHHLDCDILSRRDLGGAKDGRESARADLLAHGVALGQLGVDAKRRFSYSGHASHDIPLRRSQTRLGRRGDPAWP